MLSGRHLFLRLLPWVLTAATSLAQQNCPLPASIKPVPPDQNIFSDQQEADLGEVLAESSSSELTVIDDDALNAHLRQIGDQITRYLPPNQFRFRFYLMELPIANAFSFSGGRIYVSRKLVALARNDDEIAGLLSHELGHAVTHQMAIQMTRRFREVLGVTQVGDKADIADKYHRLLDTWRRKPDKGSANQEEAGQEVADQIALFAAARAGFSPQGGVDLLDRTLQTQGKTGGWLSDFFGATTPEQRRLREMLKNMHSLPLGCTEVAPATRAQDFQKWQADVIAYNVNARSEALPGLLFKQQLALPLRPDINNLRFSPDGKFVLAQDDGGIHVLSREKLEVLFFIEAPDAYKAMFTPDSKSIVFYTPHLRVESWDIATQQRTWAHELVLRDTCQQSELSPNGDMLACLMHDYTLSLFDVASGTAVATKKNFVEFNSLDNPFLLWLMAALAGAFGEGPAHLGFSPDGRYLLAGSHSSTLFFDLTQKREISMPASIRDAVREKFVFVGTDRLVSINGANPEKSPLLRFPTGERLQQVVLASFLHFQPAAHGDYFILGPLKDKPMGIMDVRSGKLFGFDGEGADIFDGVVLHEMGNGSVALTEVATQKPGPKIQLKQSRLGGIRAIAVADDFQWLAVSTATRGAVWDLSHNVRVSYIRGFTGAWFSPERALFADFPKKDQQERMIGRLDPLGGGSQAYAIKDDKGDQVGSYFALRKPDDEKHQNKSWTVELRDFRSNQTVWSRSFSRGIPDLVWNTAGETVLMGYPMYSDFVQEELKQFPDLKKKARPEDYFFELFDFRKNALLGKLVVNTNKGSFTVREARASGDWVAVWVSGDRTLTYSLSTGEEVGHVFGMSPALAEASGLLAVSTATGDVNVYELDGTRLRQHFSFPAAAAYKKFSPDGKRLFVLTRDQTAYVLDMTSSVATAATPPAQ